MNRRWTTAAWVAIAAVALIGVGCAKTPPEVPDAPMMKETPPAPPATDIDDTPSAPPVDDTPEFMTKDLVDMNNEARAQGLIGDVYFDFDKYDLKPEARDRLAKNAAFMRDYPSLTFTIEGHCDERGTNEYNIALGDRRANAAVDYVSSLGISRSRMKTLSYGEESPTCRESNESCWSRNRRARFLITGK